MEQTETLREVNFVNIAPQNRALTWVLVILLTVVLLLSPIQLVNEYHTIQAPYIFENLQLFGIVFYIWILVILFLLFSKGDKDNRLDWENVALVCMFGLVFVGFWVVITPYGSYADGVYNMGHVKWLVEEGSIPIGHENLRYFDFPGMHLLTFAISQICGLVVFKASTLFLILNAVLSLVLLYIFYSKLIRSGNLAFLGVMVVVLASAVMVDDMRIFYPRVLGFTLLAGFLVMLTRSNTKNFGLTVADKLLMLTLFAGMVISYFTTSLLVPLLLLGIYVIQVLCKEMQVRINLRTIILLLFMVVAWEMYSAHQMFESLARFLPKVLEDTLSGRFSTSFLTLAQANVGSRLPIWATLTRSLWMVLIGFGTILGLRNLLRINKIGFEEKIVTGALLGVILLSLIGTFGTEGGLQFYRFLLYGPLFCVPILLVFLRRPSTWRRISLALLTAIILFLSLPTFICSVNTVSTDAIYPYDIATGDFMEAHSREKAKGYDLYSLSSQSRPWAPYYIPGASSRRIPEKVFYGRNESEFWKEAEELTTKFQHQLVLPGRQKVFTISEKDISLYQHLLGIPPDDPEWENIRDSLSSTNLVYNNGHVQMYSSW